MDEQLKKLYDVVYDKKLYTKSYDEFVSKYSDVSQREFLHKTIQDEGLYTKSLDEFNTQYFGGVDVKKKDDSQVGADVSGEDVQTSSPSKSPLLSQEDRDKIWAARTAAVEGEEVSPEQVATKQLKQEQFDLATGAIKPREYAEQQIAKLNDILTTLGIQKIEKNVAESKPPMYIPTPVNALAAQHLELNKQPVSEPMTAITIGDVKKAIIESPEGDDFTIEPNAVLSQTTDEAKEADQLMRKYYPGLYEAPDPSLKNYLVGYNKSIREGVATVLNDLDNLSIAFSEVTNIPRGGAFGEAAELMEETALGRTKLPETIGGALIKGGVDLAVFLGEMEAVPVKGAGKLFTYLGTKGFVDAFAEDIEAEGESPFKTGVIGGIMGLKDAAVLHTLGYMAGYGGAKIANRDFANKLATDENSFLRKYIDKVAKFDESVPLYEELGLRGVQAQAKVKQGIANAVTALANGALYSGYTTSSNYLQTGEVDINKSIADAAIGVLLPFTSALGSAKNRAYSHFMRAPAQVTAFARGSKMQPEVARETVSKIRDVADKQGDFGTAEALRIYAYTLDAIADVKAVSEKVANNPKAYLNILKGSGASPEEIAMYKQAVYKAVAAYKIPEDVIPDFIKSMNARDEVTQMQKDLADAKAQGRTVVGYEERINEINKEIEVLDTKVNNAADRDMMIALNEKIQKGEKLTDVEWIYKDRIDPDGEKSLGVTVEGAKEGTGKLDIAKEGFVIKDELLKDKPIKTVEDVQFLRDKTNKDIDVLNKKEISKREADHDSKLGILNDRLTRLKKAEELLTKDEAKQPDISQQKSEVVSESAEGEIVPPVPDIAPSLEVKTGGEEATSIDKTIDKLVRDKVAQEEFKKKHTRSLVDVVREQLVDKTEPSKIRVLKQDKSLQRQYGKRVVNMLNLEAGAGGNALRTYKNTIKKIFGNPFHRLFGSEDYMSEKYAHWAWEYAMAKRDVEVYGLKEGERVLPEGLSIEDRQALIDAIDGKSKTGYDEFKQKTGLNDRDVNNIAVAANALRQTFREGLDRLYEENIIPQSSYDRYVIEQPWYSPIKYLEFADKIDRDGKLSGIKRLDKGSSGARVDDMMTVLGDYFNRIEYIIAKNKTYRAMAEYAKVNPDNTLFKNAELSVEYAQQIEKEKAKPKEEQEYVKPIFKETPKGFKDVDYVDIYPQRLWVEEEFYKNVNRQNEPDRIQDAVGFLGLITGKRILTAAATGYDPGFAIKNPILDFIYNFLTQKTFSPIATEAVLQYGAYSVDVIKDIVNKTGVYNKLMTLGGSQQFLSSQGRFEVNYKYGKISGASAATDIIENIASKPGQVSEMATRAVIYQMYLDNKLNELRGMGIEPDAKIMKVLEEEAVATSRAYLDFSQGGYLSKRIDGVIPYFNASTQVTRGALRAASKDPTSFALKVAQLAALQGVITTWNMTGHPDLDDETRQGMSHAYLNDVSTKLKERYYILMLPYGFEDKDGNQRYPFIKIPKDNTVSIAASVFEDMLLQGMYGIESVDKNRLSEFKNMMEGFVDVTQLPPAISAALGVSINKNLYFQEDLWKGRDVGEYREKEWMYGITPEKYQLVGKIGLSPTRAQYFVQQFLTSNNAFGHVLGYGIDGIAYKLKGDDRKVYEKNKWEQVKNAPMASRFVGISNPSTKSDKSKEVQTSLNAIRQSDDNILAKMKAEERRLYSMEGAIIRIDKDGNVIENKADYSSYLQSITDMIMSDDFIVASKVANEKQKINDVILMQEQERLLNKFLSEELTPRGVNVRNFNKYVWLEPTARGMILFNDYSRIALDEEKEQFEQDMINYSVYMKDFLSPKTLETYQFLKNQVTLPKQENNE